MSFEKYDIDEASGRLSPTDTQVGLPFDISRFAGKRVLFFDPDGGSYDIELGVGDIWTPMLTAVTAEVHVGLSGDADAGTAAQANDLFQVAEAIRFRTVTRSATASGHLGGYLV